MANVLAIDGAKLKKLLEEASGKSLKEISLEAGFSDSFLRMACKNNKATPAVTTVAKLYGIDPSAYKAPERIIEPISVKERAQISIDDLETLKREELKALITEVFNDIIFNCEIVVKSDKVKGNRLFLQERGSYKDMEV